MAVAYNTIQYNTKKL